MHTQPTLDTQSPTILSEYLDEADLADELGISVRTGIIGASIGEFRVVNRITSAVIPFRPALIVRLNSDTVEKFQCRTVTGCYHQGIDFCIERGISRFEPGTGGDHKVSRGFVPSQTCSMHWIVDPRFRDAIADYLKREGAQVNDYADEVSRHVPYRDLRHTARSK